MRGFGTVLVAVVVSAPAAWGQTAAVPVAPVAVPAAAAPAAAAPKNIFSLLCPTPEQKAACKQKFCNSAIGKLFNTMVTPLGMMTGGLLGGCCPGPNGVNPADLAKPATSAEGAAARIKADEANAAARRAAVRYLGTVNCKYYPEAEPALIASLRGDPSECVRIEAAKAFANGCCCSKKTIAALTMSVNGGTKDGFPSEQSECVRALAYAALQVCVATYQEPAKPPEKATPTPKDKEKDKETAAGPVPYYDAVAVDPPHELIRDARTAVARGLNISTQAYRQLTAEHHLLGMLSEPLRGPNSPPPTTPAPNPTQLAGRSPPAGGGDSQVATAMPPPAKPSPATEAKPASRPRTAGSLADLWQTVTRTRTTE